MPLRLKTSGLFLFVWLLFTQAAAALPNLAPYQPPGWSDKITVSRYGFFRPTDDVQITQWDVLFASTPIINNGDAPTDGQLVTTFYVDNMYWGYANDYLQLYPGQYWTTGIGIGPLSVGTHTISVWVNYGQSIAESNYSDNIYTKTFTVVSSDYIPNLAVTSVPTGWSAPIVVTKTQGNTIDDTGLTTADNLYVDWAVVNTGPGTVTTAFTITLSVDGTVVQTRTINPPFYGLYTIEQTDFAIGALTAGSHVLELIADPADVVRETNETDNLLQKWIIIAPAKKRRGQITSE